MRRKVFKMVVRSKVFRMVVRRKVFRMVVRRVVFRMGSLPVLALDTSGFNAVPL